MKKTLSLLTICSSLIAGQGCIRDREKAIDPESPRAKEADQSLRLLGKTITLSTYAKNALLYFDADGDTNTTEVVAKMVVPYTSPSIAKVFDAKIGTKKTLKTWHYDLSNHPVHPRWIDMREKQKQ